MEGLKLRNYQDSVDLLFADLLYYFSKNKVGSHAELVKNTINRTNKLKQIKIGKSINRNNVDNDRKKKII